MNSRTACFPGDVPFSKNLTLSYAQSKLINLTAITLSPHVGTHADAPSHIKGDITETHTNIGAAALEPYVGAALVLDFSPMTSGAVTAEMISEQMSNHLSGSDRLPERVLLKTQRSIDYENWAGDYPYIGTDAVIFLSEYGVRLVGIDTPSVDQVESKSLQTHHALDELGFFWLENLDLTKAQGGFYFLVAAPLRLEEAEASPLRALLLR